MMMILKRWPVIRLHFHKVAGLVIDRIKKLVVKICAARAEIS